MHHIRNMLVCHECHYECKSVKGLFRHFKQVHALLGRYGVFKCGQMHCGRTFNDKCSLTRHIKNNHGCDIESDDNNEADKFGIKSASSGSNGCNDRVNEAMEHEDIMINSEISDADLEELAAEFICKCKRASASLTAVNEIVTSCSMFIESVVGGLQRSVMTALKCSLGSSFNESQLDSVFAKYRQPFKAVDTLYKQNKYWRDKGCLVEPVEYTIGTRQVYKTDKQTGMVVPMIENVTGQYIPVKEMLQAYLGNGNKALLALPSPEPNQQCLYNYFDGNK